MINYHLLTSSIRRLAPTAQALKGVVRPRAWIIRGDAAGGRAP